MYIYVEVIARSVVLALYASPASIEGALSTHAPLVGGCLTQHCRLDPGWSWTLSDIWGCSQHREQQQLRLATSSPQFTRISSKADAASVRGPARDPGCARNTGLRWYHRLYMDSVRSKRKSSERMLGVKSRVSASAAACRRCDLVSSP